MGFLGCDEVDPGAERSPLSIDIDEFIQIEHESRQLL